ncbi:endocuticle structural glycoprotein SgAbd-2-like [Ctenocephalides felis]|uniref:endocuticle structural glycoprotein SgAbd-2-like n=1 Tax=Ctenocephalides felis TaxID=7515 RepID=UPI000E6E13F0|nr:endocuticle structural glycoprotein SgAbd-2-like [Ctenocephalides felis]
MKLFLVGLFVAVCSAGRLENNYLPPNNAQASGGNAKFLAAPYGAAGGPTTPPVPILKSVNENNGDGSYNFEYETGNGISQQESGHLENQGSENEEQVVSGSYSYTGPDGNVYTVQYRADSNGFQAFGDHLPTAPPVPEAILKSLEQNRAEEASQASQAASQQYLPPNKYNGNSNNGYHY